MQKCPHCGENHPRSAVYCPKTGKEIPKPRKLRRIITLVIIIVTICIGISFLGIGGYFFLSADYDFNELVSFLLPSENSEEPLNEEREENEEIKIAPTDPEYSPTPTATLEPSITPSPVSTITPTPTITFTPEPTATPTNISISSKDDAVVVFVEAGEFIMGVDPDGLSPEEHPNFSGPEYPEKIVTVDSFWIYQTEVTNSMYQRCVEANFCDLPIDLSSYLSSSYYENVKYANYPVVNVEWRQAATYCDWAGGRLPYEAEWEKAARGPNGNKYPWGQNDPSGTQTNLCDSNCTFFTNSYYIMDWIDDGHDGPAPVGSYPLGASYYGALDLSGNVWEWVFDRFQVSYSNLPLENPVGPASGSRRVIRGGSFINNIEDVRGLTRESWDPQNPTSAIGFRCVIEDIGE